MHEQRAFLRALLSELLAGQPGSDGLYIPRGEAGMRRMIRALLALRPPEPEGTPLDAMIEQFYKTEQSDSTQPPFSGR